MNTVNNPIAFDSAVEPTAETLLRWFGTDFRSELAFPELTEDMVDRLRPMGTRKSFPAGAMLYSTVTVGIDMLLFLKAKWKSFFSSEEGEARIYARHRKHNFTGEFNLLNSQGAVVEARTVVPSTLIRISRSQLQRLMRVEGDIANVIVAACIWRRIGIVKAASSGVILKGRPGDDQMMLLQRFFVRNNYPHRIVNVSGDVPDHDSGTTAGSHTLRRTGHAAPVHS